MTHQNRRHNPTSNWRSAAVATLIATAIVAAIGSLQTPAVFAQDEPAPDKVDADNVVQRMLEKRENSLRIAPDRDNDDNPNAVAMPASSVDIDRTVLGLAPGEEAPPLLRDGSFIIGRRGHLRPSTDGAHLLFVFEAQDDQQPTLPMILQPCALREDMEDYMSQRGNTITFIISGQVFAYRGANYLLPTMMKIAIDRPNAAQ
ncbi:hypothetical protein [Mucisphaera calidilacus]|uniref:Uncharacterized protein n=1 Tax=Mucisphaera calidilacus TaxID=2527982 RepID=A0A518BXZ0_9BACT|nr:hypothetical protein [Mucisphaera calidilacus]QDU71849.1 hypothetical protein Pan265_17030 [Mucisphaera calidilacus]